MNNVTSDVNVKDVNIKNASVLAGYNGFNPRSPVNAKNTIEADKTATSPKTDILLAHHAIPEDGFFLGLNVS